jgi:hypothetical protein
MSVFGLLLASHLVADFPLQADWMAKQKQDSYLVLLSHLTVHATVLSAFLYTVSPLPLKTLGTVVAAVSAVHALIDTRRWVRPKDSWEQPMLWVWINDQVMHIVTIAVISQLV